MSAIELIQYLSWVVFELIFVVALVKAARQPRRASLDAALLFGAPALSIILSLLRDNGVLPPSELLNDVSGSLILSLAYLLLRLVDDFSEAPGWLMGGSLGLLIALCRSSASAIRLSENPNRYASIRKDDRMQTSPSTSIGCVAIISWRA